MAGLWEEFEEQSSSSEELNDLSGYDCDFIDEPPNALVCPVCLLPCREPHILSCCGKKACRFCITRVRQAEQPCPLCRTLEFATMIDREVERQVLSLKVYCDNKQDGCGWTGELRQQESHLNTCFFANIPCKYECGCFYPRLKMLLHESDECELRPEIVLTKKIKNLERQHQQQINDLKIQRIKELNDLKTQQREQLDELKSQYRGELNDLKTQQREKLDVLKSQHHVLVNQLEDDYIKKINDLERERNKFTLLAILFLILFLCALIYFSKN